jgi:membrane protein
LQNPSQTAPKNREKCALFPHRTVPCFHPNFESEFGACHRIHPHIHLRTHPHIHPSKPGENAFPSPRENFVSYTMLRKPHHTPTWLRKTGEILLQTLKRSFEVDIATQGAAIAFYTIFSIAPLLLVVVYAGSFFLTRDVVELQLVALVADFAGEEIAANLQSLLHGVDVSIPLGSVTGLFALFVLFFGSTTVIGKLKSTLNRIWGVHEITIKSIWHYLFSRVLSFSIIVIISLLFIVVLFADILVGSLSKMLTDLFPRFDVDFYQFISQIMIYLLAVVFFTLIFKILPDVHAQWRFIIVGAVVTTVLFQLGLVLIGLLLSSSEINLAYRAAGSFVVFIVWVYYNALTILLGAVFTQVFTTSMVVHVKPYSFVVLKEPENS